MKDIRDYFNRETAPKPEPLPPPVRTREAPQTATYTYRCSNPKCRATDTYTPFLGWYTPKWVNCWKCGAGRGVPKPVMEEKKIGMYLVEQVPSIHEVEPQGQRPS